MKLGVMLVVYTASFALCAALTDLCLRRWRRTARCARRIRKCWLIPFALLSLMPVAGAFLPDCPPKFALQAAGNVWLGLYLYYGGLLLVLLAAAKLAGIACRRKPGRRLYGGVLCLSLAVALALWGYGMVHAQRPKVVAYDLAVDKRAGQAGAEMKLVLIADLHLGVNSRLATTERVAALINAEAPDAVVVAGDIFTSSFAGLSHADGHARALSGIRAKYGVYAVYGNHDVEETLLGGFAVSPVSRAFRGAEMEAFCQACGFVCLEDETVVLPNGVQLAGRLDGEKAGDGTSRRMPAGALLEGADKSRPILVLEHEPREFAALAEAGADVILCGHTHAGQVFPGDWLTMLLNENAWGHSRLHGADTFVTAGVGCYGPPMRVGTNSEITVINLKFQ